MKKFIVFRFLCMRYSINIFLFLFFVLPQSSMANTLSFPKLEAHDKDNLYCKEAYEIAVSQYNSDNFHVYNIESLPDNLSSDFILKTASVDISGGDALIANEAFFKKIIKDKKNPFFRSIYWQIIPDNGFRYVLTEDSYGWQGDMYSLFVIDEVVNSENFIKNYKDRTKREYISILRSSWRPPLIMYDKVNNKIWAIDVGQPFIPLNSWNIYLINNKGSNKLCSINFRPNFNEMEAINLLSNEIKKLAKFLDDTLGDGRNEGTLNPTARIRVEVNHVWGNAAQRPWAVLKSRPYNSKSEVDKKLKNWSYNSKSFKELYNKIYKQYPIAKKALAKYYENRFKKNEIDAEVLADKVLDIAFRSYYVFPR